MRFGSRTNPLCIKNADGWGWGRACCARTSEIGLFSHNTESMGGVLLFIIAIKCSCHASLQTFCSSNASDRIELSFKFLTL